eukprot:19923-Heterococcus_DN1.PRE.1
MRDAMSERGRVKLASVTDAVHHCSRLREGFYDVFYPDLSVLVDHLKYRNAPGVSGSYDFNPLQKNLWAIDYEQPYVQDPKSAIIKRASGALSMKCADKASGSCKLDADCSDVGAVCSKAGKCAILRPGRCVTSDHCKFSPQGNICSAEGQCTKAAAPARKHHKHQ